MNVSPTDSYPQIAVMHGTSDPTVDVRHFDALRESLEDASGMDSAHVAQFQWVLRNWQFIAIQWGNHSYGGAAEHENTRAKATNHYFPGAFLSKRGTVPDFEANWESQNTYGWRFRVHGNIKDVVLEVIEIPDGDAWMMR